jgi:hypothetical protein
MATPLFKGTTSFRLISEDDAENRSGLDRYTAVFQGEYADLDAEKAKWPRGTSTASTLGHSNMRLVSMRSAQPQSPFATLTLEFEGFLSNTTSSEPIDITDAISLQAVTLVSDETDADGNDVNVQVQYYAQTTTSRWIHYGTNQPLRPKYPTVLQSEIDSSAIFNPYPAKYPGSLQYRTLGILSEFRRERIVPGVWAVVETWTNRIEPKTPPAITNE